jgi:hypothetical protein
MKMNQKISIEIDYELSDKITLENLKQSYEGILESYDILKLRIKHGARLERYELEDMKYFKKSLKAFKRVMQYYMESSQAKEYFSEK